MRIVGSRNFAASSKNAAGIVRVKPCGLREMHWHPNVSEWQYWIQGCERGDRFNAEENARTVDFNANDVGFVPEIVAHYVENTGEEELIVLGDMKIWSSMPKSLASDLRLSLPMSALACNQVDPFAKAGDSNL